MGIRTRIPYPHPRLCCHGGWVAVLLAYDSSESPEVPHVKHPIRGRVDFCVAAIVRSTTSLGWCL